MKRHWTLTILCLTLALGLDAVPRFTLAVKGGMAYTAIGDWNRYTLARYNFLKGINSTESTFLPSEYNAVHWGMDLAGEIGLELSDSLSVILGTGYLNASLDKLDNTHSVYFPHPKYPTTFSFYYESKTAVIPIDLSLAYKLHLSPKLNLILAAGPTYFIANQTLTHGLIQSTPTVSVAVEQRAEVSAKGFGGQAQIGLELDLSDNLALTFDITGRFGKSGALKGDISMYINDVLEDVSDGTLYYSFRKGSKQDEFTVSTTSPNPEHHANIREGTVDITGVALRAGLRIRF